MFTFSDIAAQAFQAKSEKHWHNNTTESSNSCTTPFNSIVHLPQVLHEPPVREEDSEELKRKTEDEAEIHKTSLGFYVDLNDVEEPKPQSANQDSLCKKNIFSMVSAIF